MPSHDDCDDEMDGDTISAAHRAREQREYQAEYRRWFASLTPRQRAELKAQGWDQPDGDIQQINGKRRSIEDMPLAAEIEDRGATSREERSMLGMVIRRLLDSGNVPATLWAIASALGFPDFDESVETAATRFGISKQRLAVIRTEFVDAFHLPPPLRAKSLQSRTSESLKRCHKKPCNLASISQRKSASYTTVLRKRFLTPAI